MGYRRHPRAAVVDDSENLVCWILTLEGNEILALEGTGYLIWQVSLSAGNLEDIVDDLCQEFGWKQDEITQGVEHFIADLVAREVLLEVTK